MPHGAGRHDDTHGAERRRALRRLARHHHPDVGGDPQTYVRLAAALEARSRRPSARRPDVTPVQVRPAARWRLVVRRLRRAARRWAVGRAADRRRRADARIAGRAGGGPMSRRTSRWRR